jgi:hypothetical protein
MTMRSVHWLPIAAAAALLAGCNRDNADADGDGSLTTGEVVAEAGTLLQPRPGQYSTKVELLEFDAPGLPAGVKDQMQQVFAGGSAQDSTFCMTEADAAENGAEQMVKNLAKSDCDMKRFDVSGNTVVADMQCAGQGGAVNRVQMNGEMTPESSIMTMTMTMNQEMANLGAVTMKMRVASQRIGDCAG